MADRELRLRILLDAMDKASGPIGSIKDESRTAAAAVRDTRAELTRLNKAQADIKGFRDLKRGLMETEAQLDGAKRKAAALAREVAQADKPTRDLTRSFERAKREAADLGSTLDRQQRELQETRDRLSAAGVSTRDLVADERRLGQQIKSTNDQFERRKRRLQDLKASEGRRLDEARAAAKLEEKLARQPAATGAGSAEGGGGTLLLARFPVGAAALAGAGYGAMELTRQAVVSNAVYEHSLTSIGQKANLTREQAVRLGETLRRISPDSGRLPQDSAGAADTLAGIGLLGRFDGIKDTEKRFEAIQRATVEVTRVSGRAATAYGAQQDDMVRSIAAGVQNLEIPADKARRIADMMAAGDNAGQFGMAAMSSELPSLTGAWGALGQTGEKALGQLIAGLETARMIAGSDEEAATNLQNLILKLNSQELSKNFKKFGVNLPDALKKAKAEGRDLLEVISELTVKATKGDNDKIGQIFTDQQSQLAVTALITKAKEYKSLRDSIMNSEGTVDRAFDERMKDQAAKWDKLKAQASAVGISFGASLEPYTNQLIDAASNVLTKLDRSLQKRGAGGTAWEIAKSAAVPGPIGTPLAMMRFMRAVAPDPVARPKVSTKAYLDRPAVRSAMLPTNDRVKWPTPQAATGGLKAIGQEWSAELRRQNATARVHHAQALSDQRGASGQAVAEASRFKGQMRQQIGTSGEYSRMGSLMMQGVSAGISISTPGVLGMIVAVGARMKAAFRNSMEIRSPSRVFHGYGRHITAGLAGGIDAGSKAPVERVRLMARAVANQGATSANARTAAAGGEAAAGSGSIQIGPIYQQLGESGEALAQRIAALIERKKANEHRGGYVDA